MAEPKKRLSSTRSGHRRSHLALRPQNLVACTNCKKLTLSHRVCLYCGFYKGRRVLKVAQG